MFEVEVMTRLTLLIAIAYFLKKYTHSQSTGYLGCLTTNKECPNDNISFFFYTKSTSKNPIVLDLKRKETFINANFIKDRPLILLIHGYTGDKDYSPNSHIRPALFQRDDFNVISLDYSVLAKYPCYITAVGNLPTIANCTAQFLDYIIDNQFFSIDSIHVIGFSLGAQVSITKLIDRRN